MHNLFEDVRDSLVFNKFSLNDLICVEYTCPVEDEQIPIYAQSDYLIHVLSGKKAWKTIEGEWMVSAGETLFVKKGAAIVTQDFDEDFCMLGFFLPDDVIRDSLKESVKTLSSERHININQFTATKLLRKDYLDSFFHSILPYFREQKDPPKTILKLKLKELLINLLYHSDNDLLTSYLKSVTVNSEPSLTHIMENNFSFNLKLEEFAKMSHRSLSKFKRDFFNHYNMTPGKWLLSKRLDYAANLILQNTLSITQIAFESGFEDVSHFSRKFKEKFGSSPKIYSKSY